MSDTTNAPRLRFAPSPTGYLHVGGARTALFNWLYARHNGGKFLLRIEDTDKLRSTDESTRAIFEGLEWLGLDWDEEGVYQGANLERHRADALRLLESGAAYRCFCTPEELEERRRATVAGHETFKYDRRCDRLAPAEVEARVARGDPFVVRFRIPEGETEWNDMVHERIAFPNKDLDDFVILRSNGTPIYNLAVVSDDIAMRITDVMRGDDHISNTPKQILLYRALGAELPVFAHLPMIHGMDGKKLSKRHGATAVGDYQHQGLLPSAMLNFLALLGWSPGGDREVLTIPEMIELFSPDGLQKKAAIFDPKKLEWMNGQHLSLTPLAQLEPRVTPAILAAGLADEATLAANVNGTSISSICCASGRGQSTTLSIRRGPIFSRTSSTIRRQLQNTGRTRRKRRSCSRTWPMRWRRRQTGTLSRWRSLSARLPKDGEWPRESFFSLFALR